MRKILVAMLTALTLWSCDKKDETPPTAITVPNQEQLTQTVFADNSTGASAVNFTTNGVWSSSISVGAGRSSSGGSAPDWISIDPTRGDKAGSYTVNISLTVNQTGVRRSATIAINCGGEQVLITVTQDALTASGKLPQDEPKGMGVITNNTTQVSVNLVSATHSVTSSKLVRIAFRTAGISSVKPEEFFLDFGNPLVNGRLKPGAYMAGNRNNNPTDGLFVWFKSSLGGYSSDGTIKVEQSGNAYSFTLNFKTEDGAQISGNYVGELLFLNMEIKVSEVRIDKNQLELDVNRSANLNATVLPGNSLNKAVVWRSSDPTVATVDQKGAVQALKEGEAIITVTSDDGGKMASCAITVKAMETTGTGLFTYSLGGKDVETFTVVRVVEDGSGTIRFYDSNQYEGAYFHFYTSSKTLEAGTYQWDSVKTAFLRWHSQKGTFGKTNYYCEGVVDPGILIVSKSGTSYTITLNWNVMNEGVSGTIKGTYTGTIKVSE